MKKSILAILLGVITIAVMLPVHVLADESDAPAPEGTEESADSEPEEIYSEMSNIFGDDLEYGIDAEGVLYVGGTGSMKNEVPWRGREDEIRAVNIGYDVTDISPGAFENCKYLTSASLGWSVRVIGDGAFKNCTSLKEITIPNELTYIGNELFYNCSSLTTVTFPGIDKITEIGESAFYKCSKLTKIEIPATVTHIKSYAFSYCSALTEINMPEFADLGVQSFRGCTSLSKIRFDAHNDNIYVKDGMAISTYDDDLGYPREQVEFCLAD